MWKINLLKTAFLFRGTSEHSFKKIKQSWQFLGSKKYVCFSGDMKGQNPLKCSFLCLLWCSKRYFEHMWEYLWDPGLPVFLYFQNVEKICFLRKALSTLFYKMLHLKGTPPTKKNGLPHYMELGRRSRIFLGHLWNQCHFWSGKIIGPETWH